MRWMLAVAVALWGGMAAAEGRAILAGGCFWCVEADFEGVPGVLSVVSGYTGGTVERPTYDQVTGGRTGHYEAVDIRFDERVIGHDRILHLFFRSVDPTDAGGQFCDRGDSYRTAIFALDAGQRRAAEAAKAEAGRALGRAVVTPVLDAGAFWPAEDYHQDYYTSQDLILTRFGPRRKAVAYDLYRQACGRDARVQALWGAEAAFVKR